MFCPSICPNTGLGLFKIILDRTKKAFCYCILPFDPCTKNDFGPIEGQGISLSEMISEISFFKDHCVIWWGHPPSFWGNSLDDEQQKRM